METYNKLMAMMNEKVLKTNQSRQKSTDKTSIAKIS